MKKYVARENVGMRNPYALADYIDSKHKRPKKDWNKIFLGLELEPEFKDVLSAMIDSLKAEPEYQEWLSKHSPSDLFNPETGSPLYTQKERKILRSKGR